MGFLGDFVNVRTRDGRNFILLDPIMYVTKAGKTIVIPRGAQSDGASTPFVMWPTLPPFGEYWKAAWLHDATYRNYAEDEHGNKLSLPRDECDALLLEAMESCQVPDWQCQVIHRGVKIGGSWAFVDDREKKTG